MRKHFKGIFLALAAVLPAVAGCDKEDKYLNVDPGSVELNSDAQYIYVDIDASASWMGYCSSEWLEAFMPGDSVADNTSKLCLRIATANLSLYDRETEVTVVTGDAQTYILPVLQRAVDVLISVSPNSLLEFSSMATETYTLTVTADLPGNEDWVYETEFEWLTAEQGTGNDSDKITVTADRSMQFEDRRDSVFVRPANDNYAARTVKVPVIQYGANLYVAAENGFTMDKKGTVEISDANANVTLSVFSNAAWTVVTDDTLNRISMSLTGGGAEKENGTAFVISVPANVSASEYSYKLTFTCGGENYEYKLVQAAP